MRRTEYFCNNCEERIEKRGDETPSGREGFTIVKGEPMTITRELDAPKDKVLAHICYQCLRSLLAYWLPRRIDARIAWGPDNKETIGPLWSDPPMLTIEL